MPREGEKRFTEIKVCCPSKPYAVYKMCMTIIYTKETDWIPLPCNGCDEGYCGSTICMKCTAAVTELFIDDPLRHPYETIYPDIQKFSNL